MSMNSRSEYDKHEFRFMGRAYEEIKDNMVTLQEQFIPSLMETYIHFVAEKGKGHIKLIPGDPSSGTSLLNAHDKEKMLSPPSMKMD